MFTETPKANPETPAVKKAGKYHALAEAIRQGCEISPIQCYAVTYFQACGKLASCALGAAALAMGFQYDRGRFHAKHLLSTTPQTIPRATGPLLRHAPDKQDHLAQRR